MMLSKKLLKVAVAVIVLIITLCAIKELVKGNMFLSTSAVSGMEWVETDRTLQINLTRGLGMVILAF